MTRLSYILATDTYATIRPVVDRLRRQTIRQQLEVVLIAPSRSAVESALAHASEFSGIVVVEHPVEDLAQARAAGIRAASGAVVFIGETHSYPHPEMAERLLATCDQGFVCAVPGLGNANPGTVHSWAGFLSDYGPWLAVLPEGEIRFLPIYNAAFRRAALLDLGERLGFALAHGDELPLHLNAGGHRSYFVPSARLDHVNVAPIRDWMHERFIAGLLIAHHRSGRWTLARRALYVLASPAIPLVLLWRVLPGIRAAARTQPVPAGTLPLVVFGFLIKGVGELAGYLRLPSQEAELAMQEYEVHKLAYAGKAVSK